MSDKPSTAIGNGDGRKADGTFASGHKFAKGNPNNARAQKLRNAVIRAVTRGDVRAILKKMVDLAKGGDAVAAKLVLDRTLGKVSNADVIERIEALEQLMHERNGSGGKWN
jgi:hypothetical protein